MISVEVSAMEMWKLVEKMGAARVSVLIPITMQTCSNLQNKQVLWALAGRELKHIRAIYSRLHFLPQWDKSPQKRVRFYQRSRFVVNTCADPSRDKLQFVTVWRFRFIWNSFVQIFVNMRLLSQNISDNLFPSRTLCLRFLGIITM